MGLKTGAVISGFKRSEATTRHGDWAKYNQKWFCLETVFWRHDRSRDEHDVNDDK